MIGNIGRTDRIVRVIVGAAIAALGIYFKSWWGLLAVVPLLTAALGFCGLYMPFNISTLKRKESGRFREDPRRPIP